jgi:phosphoserine phosphatase
MIDSKAVKKNLIIFDFDHTVVNENTDTVINKLF